MKLQGESGTAFELEVAGYRSPEVADRFWEANWLLVRCRIAHPRGAWSFSEPSLATFELEQLARWFEGVAQGKPDPKAGYFTESHLTFSYEASPAAAIAVRFAFEAAPPWLVDRNQRLDGAVVSFPLALNAPRSCAQDLRAQLVRFPQRGHGP